MNKDKSSHTKNISDSFFPLELSFFDERKIIFNNPLKATFLNKKYILQSDIFNRIYKDCWCTRLNTFNMYYTLNLKKVIGKYVYILTIRIIYLYVIKKS